MVGLRKGVSHCTAAVNCKHCLNQACKRQTNILMVSGDCGLRALATLPPLSVTLAGLPLREASTVVQSCSCRRTGSLQSRPAVVDYGVMLCRPARAECVHGDAGAVTLPAGCGACGQRDAVAAGQGRWARGHGGEWALMGRSHSTHGSWQTQCA